MSRRKMIPFAEEATGSDRCYGFNNSV